MSWDQFFVDLPEVHGSLADGLNELVEKYETTMGYETAEVQQVIMHSSTSYTVILKVSNF
ncbi:hypothetical protein [Halobacillus kuroshimensis]|uniref:hypothetical protein n=1 Tax=Halobacillus kuroshimensis TaxID=302481 RepID=UPI0004847026|nr:hypothetical protein [Halobacillus kuroshimensis]